MPLTNTKILNAKPLAKSYKLFDERGLYLEVAPAGGKWWRFKYRYRSKEKRISLGTYPDISLVRARERRDEARTQVAEGLDPSEVKKAQKHQGIESSENSFEIIALEWHLNRAQGWSQIHAENVMGRLKRDVFPWLGKRPVAEITPTELLSVLRRIEERGANETAHRVKGNCGEVFRYAIATGRADRNIAADLTGALVPAQKKHLASVTKPEKVGELLRAIEGYSGTLTVRSALKLAPLVFVRPGELRTALWADIDLANAEWRFLVTKTKTELIVPLATQAVAILTELAALTGNRAYVFPSARSPRRPMSNNAVLSALRRMEIGKEEMSGHGFRAMARTILDEILGYRPDIIEHQLAHQVRDPLGRAYNRTSHLAERTEMMQAWADYLDKIKTGT
ncbi:integrase arm-type DNA-binding domain-containing protein [Pseudomonadales bacterium]|nr:integrase arm-type DNA-binding domain-containing protein [Pseudomonadales bacterium]